MSSSINKKNVHFLQIQNFLKSYAIIVFLQHNNLAVKNWSQIQLKLKNIENSKTLLFKNTVMKKCLVSYFSKKQTQEKDSFEFFFQGPSFACGCQTFAELQDMIQCFKSTENIVLIGGLYSDQILSHLDIEKLVTLDTTMYQGFLNTFQQKEHFYGVLQSSLDFTTLTQLQSNFLMCLDQLKTTLKTP